MVILYILLGVLVGFLGHAIAMQVSFKQETIKNKITTYSNIISYWVKLRNSIYDLDNKDEYLEKFNRLNLIHGETQKYVGEAFLFSEDIELLAEINKLNNDSFNTNWLDLDLNKKNLIIESLKDKAINIIIKMRSNIQNSTKFSWDDLKLISCNIKYKQNF